LVEASPAKLGLGIGEPKKNNVLASAAE